MKTRFGIKAAVDESCRYRGGIARGMDEWLGSPLEHVARPTTTLRQPGYITAPATTEPRGPSL